MLSVDDNGVMETSSKTLPILLMSVDLDVYPEGGDLIAGLRTRVYVEATAPSGDPADIVGGVFAVGSNAMLVKVRTTHEGRGVSEYFTPPDAGM